MTNQLHITNLIPDYVLGLLSGPENRQVEHHVQHCTQCRLILAREREIGLMVRQTLTIVSRPEAGRLAALMPAPPRTAQHRPFAFFRSGQQMIATALLVLLIIAGTFSLSPAGRAPIHTQQNVVTAIAATATREPTSTIIPATLENEPSSDPSPTFSRQYQPNHTPLPAGTPIAALDQANQP